MRFLSRVSAEPFFRQSVYLSRLKQGFLGFRFQHLKAQLLQHSFEVTKISRYSTIHAIKSSPFRTGSPTGGSWLNSIVSTFFSVGPQPSFMILFCTRSDANLIIAASLTSTRFFLAGSKISMITPRARLFGVLSMGICSVKNTFL